MWRPSADDSVTEVDVSANPPIVSAGVAVNENPLVGETDASTASVPPGIARLPLTRRPDGGSPAGRGCAVVYAAKWRSAVNDQPPSETDDVELQLNAPSGHSLPLIDSELPRNRMWPATWRPD